MAVDQAVAGVVQQHITLHGIALVLRVTLEVEDGVPSADVAPPRVHGYHGSMLSALHDRVVDRFTPTGAKGGGVDPQKIQVLAAPSIGAAARFSDIRRQGLQLLQIALSTEQEDAAVPKVIATIKINLGAIVIGLFDKGIDAIARAQCFATANITIAGMRA